MVSEIAFCSGAISALKRESSTGVAGNCSGLASAAPLPKAAAGALTRLKPASSLTSLILHSTVDEGTVSLEDIVHS